MVNNEATDNGMGATTPDVGSFGVATPGFTRIVTVLGGVDATTTTNTGGGARIDPNGDARLESPTGLTTAGSYTRLTTVDINTVTGEPDSASQRWYAAYPDPANPGQYLPLGTPFESVADLNTFVAETPITAVVFSPLGLTPTPLPATGGNLTVGGQVTTNGIDNTGDKITNLATGVADTDAANVGQVTAAVLAETNRATAAEGVLTTDLAAEVTRATDAEGVLTTDLAAEVTRATDA
jgi:hypothetical protein